MTKDRIYVMLGSRVYHPVADPGFPVGGGRGPCRGGMDSRGSYVS